MIQKLKKRLSIVMLFTATTGCEKENYLTLKGKSIACFLLLFFGITSTIFSQQQDIRITGTNNIAQTLKSSLSSIPNLRIGNLSLNVDTYGITGSSLTAAYMSFYIEGTLSVDYFEIVMSDGKVIRFNQNGNGFSCGVNDFPAGVDGPRSHSFAPYAKVIPRGKTELGPIHESSWTAHFNFSATTFKTDWGGQRYNNDVSAVRSLAINCSPIDSRTLDDLNRRVRLLREEYDLLKNQNSSSNTSNSTGNNKSSNNQNNTSSNNSRNNSNRQRNNNSQSQPVWDAYQNTLSNTQNTLDEWQRERESNEEEDDGEREESTAERKRREYAEAKEREENKRIARNEKIDGTRESVKNIFNRYAPGELPTSATKANTNKLYYFIYTGISEYDGHEIFDGKAIVKVSNVFAIGQYPDGTWPMKTTIQEEVKNLTSWRGIIHGPYSSEQEAQTAVNNFKNEIINTGLQLNEITYAGKNANVNATSTKRNNQPALDYWGNPIKKTNTTPSKKITPQTTSKQPEKRKQKLDYWGNPIK